MKATWKSRDIDELLTHVTGRNRRQCVEEGVCTTCGSTVTEFRDELSAKEFTISGMCQRCQDEVFTEDSVFSPDAGPSRSS